MITTNRVFGAWNQIVADDAVVHALLDCLAGILILAVAVQARRARRGDAAIHLASTRAAMLVLIEATMGALMVAFDFSLLLGMLYVAAAVGVWPGPVVLTVLAGLASDTVNG